MNRTPDSSPVASHPNSSSPHTFDEKPAAGRAARGLASKPTDLDQYASQPASSLGEDDLKSCCASFYQEDLVAKVLGESYHPGGLRLTRRLGAALDLQPGEKVLDVASGPGTTAFLLARERQVEVEGIDLGQETVAKATDQAVAAGLDGKVHFTVGDAERLPVPDASFDVLICECAFCTFPDKTVAAGEFARVLRPGGRLGITDVVIDPNRLSPELRSLAAYVACIADARPLQAYQTLLESAGFEITQTETHDGALAKMIDMIGARLDLLKMTETPLLANVTSAEITARVTQCRTVVEEGIAGYALLTAVKRDEIRPQTR